MPPRRRSATAKDAAAFLSKADEFLAAAAESLDRGWMNAAASNAIHAGISACDALCSARLGERSASQNHHDAVELVRSIRPDGPKLAQILERLVRQKTAAEYDPALIALSTAKASVTQATRLVESVRDAIG